MKNIFPLLALFLIGISIQAAQAELSIADAPAVKARMIEVKKMITSAINEAPPMVNDGVTVRNAGELTLNPKARFYPENEFQLTDILLSNGVKASVGLGYSAVRKSEPVLDAYKSIVKGAQCTVALGFAFRKTELVNQDTAGSITELTFDRRAVRALSGNIAIGNCSDYGL